MSSRTSGRVKKPSSRLLETQEPAPGAAESSTGRGSASSRTKAPGTKVKGGSAASSSRNAKSSQRGSGNAKASGARGRGQKVKGEEVEDQDMEDDEEEEDKVYCICKSTEDGKKMIECENCHDWFHFKCVGLTMTQVSKIHEYVCPLCNDASEGELKTILRSDISLLPSPPRSTSPDPQPERKSKRGKGRAKGAADSDTETKPSKTKTGAKSGKSQSKSDRSVGGHSRKATKNSIKTGADDGEDDYSMADNSSRKGSFRSSSSSAGSSAEASSGDEGSVYGNGEDGDRRSKRRRLKLEQSGSERDDSDGSSQGAPEQPDLGNSPSGSRPSRPAKQDSKRKRKSSDASSNRPAAKKRRVSSTTAGAGADAGAISSPYTDWTPIRDFCLKKLQGTLGLIMVAYRRSLAEASAKSDGPSSSDAMTTSKREAEAGQIEFDETRTSADAEVYAKAVEQTMYTRYKELNKVKPVFIAGQAYKQQYNLVVSALEKDLRPDLAEGISSGRIPPQDLAVMNSRDLASAEALEQILKTEAELLRTTVRLEDEQGPSRYTKKAMEDAETLQEIEKAVAKQSSGRRNSSRQMEKAPSDDALTPDMTAPLDGGVPMETDGIVSGGVTAVAPVTPAPASAVKSRPPGAERPSFSLTATLNGKSSGTRRVSEISNNLIDAKQSSEELPDFTQTSPAIGESPRMKFSEEPDYFGGETSQSKPVTKQKIADILQNLPVVWTGEIYNPAQPDLPLPLVDARQIGGPDQGTDPALWKRMLKSSPVELVGRVGIANSAKYLASSRFAPSKVMFVVIFTPSGEGTRAIAEQRERFRSLLDFHVERARHGVMKPHGSRAPPGCPQEVYFVPMSKSERFDFADTMDRFLLPSERDDDVLLGVFICAKVKGVETVHPNPLALPQPEITPLASAESPSLSMPQEPPKNGQALPVVGPTGAPAVPPALDIQALLASLNPQALLLPSKTSSSQQIPQGPGFPPAADSTYTSAIPYGAPPLAPALNPSSSSGIPHGQPRPPVIPLAMTSVPLPFMSGHMANAPFQPPPPGLTQRAPPQPVSGQGPQMIDGRTTLPQVRPSPPIHPSRQALLASPPVRHQQQHAPQAPPYGQQQIRPSYGSPPQRYPAPRPPPPSMPPHAGTGSSQANGYGQGQGYPGQRSPPREHEFPPPQTHNRGGYGGHGHGYGQGQSGQGGSQGRS